MNPSVIAFTTEGENFSVKRTGNPQMNFDGRGIKVIDQNFTDVTLKLPDGTEEKYTYREAELRVGNILIPSKRYIEPVGTVNIKCSNGC